MYHSFQAVLLFLATLATPALAVDLATDIIFYKDAGLCNDNGDWIYCSDVPAGYCCQTARPFCERLSCKHCSGKTLAAFRKTFACPGLDYADSSCTPEPGTTCCLDAGSDSPCTGSYYDADTKRRSDGGGFSATPPNSTCVTPDGMVYHDAAGTRREIRNMTAETYQKVMDLYVKGDLNALNGTIIQAQGWEG